MSEEKTPRERWVGDDWHVVDEYREGYVRYREILPDHIDDTMRLDWLLKNIPIKDMGRFVIDAKKAGHKTPREAIDAAMKEKK